MKATHTTDAPAVIELGADLSPAVLALEKGYRMIQKRFPEVPNATIVVKRDSHAWGHTTVHHVWSPATAETPDRLEIMVSGENLARGAVYVAATLIHEAAHARDLAAGILDTDSNGRHNRKFQASAQHLGLTVAEQGWHGYASTSLDELGQKKWAALINTITRGLTKSAKAQAPKPVLPLASTGTAGISIGGGVTVTPPRKRGDRNLIKASCSCGHSIRVSKGVLALAEPTCQLCMEPFLAA